MLELPITSERFRIRALHQRDAALFCQLFTDLDTMRLVGPAWTQQRAERHFEAALRSNNRNPPTELFLVISEKTSDVSVGISSIQHIDPERRRAEFGLMLTPSSQRKRFSREIVSVIVPASFRALPIDEIWAQYDSQNIPAERGLAALGFTACGENVAQNLPAGTRVRSTCRRQWLVGEDEPSHASDTNIEHE